MHNLLERVTSFQCPCCETKTRPIFARSPSHCFSLEGEYSSELQEIRFNTISGQYYEVRLVSKVEVGSNVVYASRLMKLSVINCTVLLPLWARFRLYAYYCILYHASPVSSGKAATSVVVSICITRFNIQKSCTLEWTSVFRLLQSTAIISH